MSSQVREHAFEPFFTTKPKGRGSGLGLAICFGVVSQAGGCIRCESEPGLGTSMRVLLPSAEGTARDERGEEGEAARAGCETILLVEDEPTVRDLVGRQLADAGYRVVPAADGQEALERYEAGGAVVDLVITDVVMPRVGGLELVMRLRTMAPGLRVLFVSGYTGDLVAPDELPGDFLQKPFSIATLLAAVRKALDGDAGEGERDATIRR
jgi:hypothetical protein